MKGRAERLVAARVTTKTVHEVMGQSFLAGMCARVVTSREIVTAAGVRGSRQPLLSLPF
jgi:hypothetical protein